LKARYPSLSDTIHDGGSALVLPLLDKSRPIGGLYYRFTGPRTFGPDDRDYLMALGRLCAAALERARLHDLERRTGQRAAFLAEASATLAGSLDFEATVEQVAELTVPAIADYCSVHLLESNGSIRTIALAGPPENLAAARRFLEVSPPAIGDPAGIGAVIRDGRAIVVPRVTDEMLAAGIEDPVLLEAARGLEVYAHLSVPLRVGGHTIGALALTTTTASGRSFEPDDLALAGELASRAALAIENARLYSALAERATRAGAVVLLPPAAAWSAANSAAATDAFGRPLQGTGASAPSYAPNAAPQGYANANGYPTQPVGPTTTKDPARRKGGVALVAALAIGALVGGASGAGVTALVLTNQTNAVRSSQAQGPSNVVVNNTDSVNQITAVAAKASPSVVTIDVASGSTAGTGSGVVLSEDGYVLTNTHVVTLDGAVANPTIQVTGNDGKLYKAKIIGTDPISDLAVIKLTDATGLQPINWADSGKLNVGDSVVAIGAPLGLSGSVTNGIVSALNRSITVASSAAPTTPDQTTPDQNNGQSPFDFWNDIPNQGGSQSGQSATSTISLPVIQTDAAINPGNSGGALLNAAGELVGINVAIASAGSSSSGSSAAGSIGVGFAIPANLAKRVANEIIANGKATHGLLGASVADIADEASTANSSVVGATIVEVTSGGGAAAAGLQKGDVVTSFNGVPITGKTDLTAQVRVLAAGAKTQLNYVRGGKTYTANVTLGTLK